MSETRPGAAEIARRVAARETSAEAVTREHLDRIARRGRRRWTRSSPSPPTARSRRPGVSTPPSPAEARRGRWPGVPVAVKDLLDIEGTVTTCGSRILEGYRPPFTATAVAAPRSRGRHRDRQDEHGRVRDGLVHREQRLQGHPQSRGTARACRADPPAAPPWP